MTEEAMGMTRFWPATTYHGHLMIPEKSQGQGGTVGQATWGPAALRKSEMGAPSTLSVLGVFTIRRLSIPSQSTWAALRGN